MTSLLQFFSELYTSSAFFSAAQYTSCIYLGCLPRLRGWQIGFLGGGPPRRLTRGVYAALYSQPSGPPLPDG